MEDLKALEMSLLQGTPLLHWDRFAAWVHGICVVTFDLELGQAIERVYPEHIALSDIDKTNICSTLRSYSLVTKRNLESRLISSPSFDPRLFCLSLKSHERLLNRN